MPVNWRMIENMGYEEDDLRDSIEAQIETARKKGHFTQSEAKELGTTYTEELLGYPYLE